MLEWASNPVNDMVSDSVIALLLNVQSRPTLGMVKAVGVASCTHMLAADRRAETLQSLLSLHYSDVRYDSAGRRVIVTHVVHGAAHTAAIQPLSLVRAVFACVCLVAAQGRGFDPHTLRRRWIAPTRTSRNGCRRWWRS